MLAAPIAERMSSVHALLPLKCMAPPPRPGVLLRQDLQGFLSEARLNLLTLVTAPAGYGKTTLLSQWAQELHRTGTPACWLSLDAGERDVAMFLAYLIKSFQTIFPTIGSDAWRILHSVVNIERDWPLVAGALCSDLQRRMLGTAFLILDDVHLVLDSAVVTQVIGYLLRAAPPALHVVLASRRMSVFAPLGRMRAEGRVVELTQRHLHLTTNEVAQILAGQQVDLSHEGMQMLLARTEGWVLSVQLAARALASQPPERREEFVRALGGSQEQLLHYLSAEVLSDLPADIIDFLRLAAIPTSFDADLLSEVLQSEDVNYLLQRARALGLPLLPLDDQGVRMRFHPLWRELLLRGTAAELDDLGLRVLQRRFGHVFESRGDLEAAMEHYAAARDTTDLIRALRERAWPLIRTPRRDTVRRWIEALPFQVREREPDLVHMYAISKSSTAPGEAVLLLHQAISLYHEADMYERELRALADLSVLSFWAAQPDDYMWIGKRVCELATLLRDDWSVGAMRVCVAAMLLAQGREFAALKVARQAALFPLNPSWQWVLAIVTAIVGIRLGRPTEVMIVVENALRLPAIDLDDRLRQNLLRFKAIAMFEQGDTTESVALALESHHHLNEYGQNMLLTISTKQLALMMLMLGRNDEAATYLGQSRVMMQEQRNIAGLAGIQVLELFSATQRGQHPAENDIANLLRRLEETAGAAPDLRMWLLLAIVAGESGYDSRALAQVTDTIQRLRERGYHLFLACAWLYMSYLQSRLDMTEQAATSLAKGWHLVVAEQVMLLPLLPTNVVIYAVRAALLAGLHVQTTGRVLYQQIAEHASDILSELLASPNASARLTAAKLIIDVGAQDAYSLLRGLTKDRDAEVRRVAEEALSRVVYRPAYTLRIRTLGAFGLWRGDHEVKDRDWRSSKARQLFQILITERGKTLPRDWVLETLWPEMDSEAAANNLRVTMNRMSKAIEPNRPDGAPSSYIIQNAETYCFNTAIDHELDTTQFVAFVEAGREAERRGQRHEAIVAYRQATNLYGGPYLPDNMYEDWTTVERERMALLFNEAALRLGALLMQEGLVHEAIGLAWRVLEYDQTQEEAYQLLMQAHTYLGERSTALRLYNRCVTVLQQELGLEPLEQTTALAQAIREASEVRMQRAPA